jgi:hypothetical protein
MDTYRSTRVIRDLEECAWIIVGQAQGKKGLNGSDRDAYRIAMGACRCLRGAYRCLKGVHGCIRVHMDA